MKRTVLLPLILLLPIAWGAFAVTDRVTFRRDAWQADFAQLKAELERSYANLQWSRPAKHVDLVALSRNTEQAIADSRSNKQAHAAIANFLRGFDDAHLHIENGPPKPIAAIMKLWPHGGEPRVEFAMSAAQACQALGYNPDGNFTSSVIDVDTDHKYVLIRIPQFSEYDYGIGCERAWKFFTPGKAGACDAACQNEFGVIAKQQVAQLLAGEARRAMRTATGGVVFDLTGNGGGSEWAEYAAAALSPTPLRTPRVVGIRGPHHRAELGDSADVRCDLRAIWTDRQFQPACWNVALLPEDRTSYLGVPQPFTGKVFVMVDANTASAAEYFAAVLQDNHAATILGKRTMGVGCGYTNGGVRITLAHSGLVVRTPDCVRLRADGTNEYVGVTPDVSVDWGESEATKKTALQSALHEFAM